jgi:hypothetical protein
MKIKLCLHKYANAIRTYPINIPVRLFDKHKANPIEIRKRPSMVCQAIIGKMLTDRTKVIKAIKFFSIQLNG